MIIDGNKKYLNDIIILEKTIYPQPWSKNHFENDLKHPAGYNKLFIIDDKCIAYLFGHSIEEEFHLNNLSVCKKYQKQGIATLLLNDVIQYSINSDISKILLEVRCDNYAAINLYEKFKFEKYNIRKNYYKKGKDAFLYSKNLK
tara:strand:- start:4276 stop:4707 length:432 start_codon:yes stop_codon:yes gene_type:complete